jgi:hypothetical protein
MIGFLLVAVIACSHVNAFSPARFALSSKLSTQLNLKAEKAKENETEEEMRARLVRKARKMMFNENGVAYAPWISKQIDEDAIVEDLIRKEKSGTADRKTSMLDKGEIESSEGMRWRMSGNQVDLAWVTGGEESNQGFIIEKRPSYGGDFQEVASFKEVAGLLSKGAAGGRYRYTDPSSAKGSWIYRVKDLDNKGESNILCQCFVEVQTESDTKSQAVRSYYLCNY